jgi:hypothetical protein
MPCLDEKRKRTVSTLVEEPSEPFTGDDITLWSCARARVVARPTCCRQGTNRGHRCIDMIAGYPAAP